LKEINPGMIRYFLAIILLLPIPIAFAQKPANAAFNAYKQEYKKELSTIIKEDTSFVTFYKFNPKMMATAKVEILKDEPVFKMTTSSGKTKDAQKYALLRFTLNGKPFKLFVYQLLVLKNKAETADDLFVPFTDFTCSNGSYGGGRYLDFKLKDIVDGTLNIDFNKAYNPYCAFTTGYNCPIPPRENDIPIAIKAGEKYNPEKFKH
jgi:uncharacterized protein (DUF1684 family)